MDLLRIRRVVVLARLLNFTKAANVLEITQSAPSRSIQAAEQAAGSQLFDRDRGSVKLARLGQALVKRAEAYFSNSTN